MQKESIHSSNKKQNGFKTNEVVRRRAREYYWNNREKVLKRQLETSRLWRIRNPERGRELSRLWKLRNPERDKEKKRVWYQLHKKEISRKRKLLINRQNHQAAEKRE